MAQQYPFITVDAIETEAYETGYYMTLQTAPGAVPLPGASEEGILHALRQYFEALSPTVEVRIRRTEVVITDVTT
ncbi:hypothetical protein [Streptomyces sp. Isolate_219]|uniref:hypothetical protein n=1 Tax=Streptomyces sp. Isolate_219 TaxID=2950110 RepID=UPI0021C8E34F|nr:hypothetical protein [Streptomyces sp. Isolate_219]MCR8574666.1 hypothetical protein [Streptomyces sp. Isolate_219]